MIDAHACENPESFFQRGSTFDNIFVVVFLVDERRKEDPITTIICWPLMALRLLADDGPTCNAGLVALPFSGDPDQFCYGTLFYDFSGRES